MFRFRVVHFLDAFKPRHVQKMAGGVVALENDYAFLTGRGVCLDSKALAMVAKSYQQ